MTINRVKSLMGSAAAAGLLFALTGCVVQEREYVERRQPVRRDVRVESEPPPPPAEELVSDAEDVYEPAPPEAIATYETDLNPHGSWVVIKDYGRCWVPRERPVGWRPYTVGRWVNTDDGWCWNAEGPEAEWGVVTYHYGRWYEDPRHGWCWVPGTTWAPAWVAWRDGGGYCGWAPLPPRVGYRREITSVYVERVIPRDRYVFVEQRYMNEPHVSRHVVVNNVTVINKTTNITNITYVNNRVVNRGVSVTEIERSSGRRVETVHTTQVTSASEARRLRSEGKEAAYIPTTISKADVEYRQRVERRVADQKAERERVARRATDANKAEHDRGASREKEAADAKAAEKARIERRNLDTAAADKAEHERAIARQKQADAAKAAEKARVERRTIDADKAEHDRAVARQKEADAAKAAEHDRALRRAKEEEDAKKKTVERSVKTTTPKVDSADAAKAAERERVARRAKEEADAKAKAAEHERALRRARDEEAAKKAAADKAAADKAANDRNGK